jgi:hypothetical protein
VLRQGGARQEDGDQGAPANLAVEADVTAGLLDEAVDDAEPEPGPLARLLGREERFEDVLGDVAAYSDSGIGNRQRDIMLGAVLRTGDGAHLVGADGPG